MKKKVKRRICTKCGLCRSLGEFYDADKGKYGKDSVCKECRRSYARRHRKENKKYYVDYNKKYYKENKEYFANYNEEYRKANREYYLNYYRKYHEENKDLAEVHRQQGRDELNKVKQDLGCCICGKKVGKLDAHHWQDNKEFDVASNVAGNKIRLWKEFEKCHVLCSSCHKKVHNVLRGNAVVGPLLELENYLIKIYDVILEEII